MAAARSAAAGFLNNFRLPETGERWQTNDMKMLKSFFIIGSLLCAGVAFAEDEMDLNHAITELNGISKQQYARGATYGAVAAQTGVPIVRLMADRRATNLNYGELLVAESIAAATGKSVQAVIAQQSKGQGWSYVARQNKINPVSLTARLRAAGQQLHAVAERSFNEQRRLNINDNYGRVQGNAQALEARGMLGR